MSMASQAPVVRLNGVSKAYAHKFLLQSRSFSLRDVSLEIFPGEVVGILGESGSGKSTVANILTRLLSYDSGEYLYKQRDVKALGRKESFQFKSEVQIIFQDPFGSLNPRATVGNSVREALILHKKGLSRKQMNGRVSQLFDEVGLPAASHHRYPHEFSGGQRQRIAIARALAVEPELLVCDEPLSSLDVSIQAQVIELFIRLISDHGLTMVFITHDLNVARLLCDRVYIMNDGRVVEQGKASDVLNNPKDEYTARLLEAVY